MAKFSPRRKQINKQSKYEDLPLTRPGKNNLSQNKILRALLWTIPGMRIIKTGMAIALCLIVSQIWPEVRVTSTAIVALFCLQHNLASTFKSSFNRVVGTLFAGLFGYPFLVLSFEVLELKRSSLSYGLLVVLGTILVMQSIVRLKCPGGAGIAAMTFLSICFLPGTQHQASSLFYTLGAVADSLIGIFSALVVDWLPPLNKLGKYLYLAKAEINAPHVRDSEFQLADFEEKSSFRQLFQDTFRKSQSGVKYEESEKRKTVKEPRPAQMSKETKLAKPPHATDKPEADQQLRLQLINQKERPMDRGILIIECADERQQVLAREIRKAKIYSEIINLEKFQAKLSTEEGRSELSDKYAGLIFAGLEEHEQTAVKNQISQLDLPYLMLDKSAMTSITQDDITSFAVDRCKASASWTVESFVERQIAEIRATVGHKKLLCGLSGGVDSSVAASLVAQAVGEQLVCVFVDHGLMRKNEGDEVEAAFKNNFPAQFIRVEAEERFLHKLQGVTDPEQKRKIIGEEFIRVFEDEAKNFSDCAYLVQGTIYPDVLESQRGDKLIKSHHNVGGLPSVIDFEGLIEPLRDLFKDEVREVGRYLGLPEDLVWRQPFPGPGLAVRCLGELNKAKLDILRDADAIFREEIKKAGLHKEINQYFAVLTNLRSVGIKNGQRSYDYVLALRAVQTKTFMTAQWARIPYEVLARVSERICEEVDGVGRIVYEITGKPPATIEWE